jgi:hypothetical protein
MHSSDELLFPVQEARGVCFTTKNAKLCAELPILRHV